MIALCAEHHAKADAGAFSAEQLRQFKELGKTRAEEVRGRFEWMRHDLLGVVGGNFYYRTPVIFEFRGEPAIWFNRDADGYLLLNFRMLTLSGLPRVRLEDNYWLPRGEPDDLECPPSGKRLKVSYANGDLLQVEFFEAVSLDFMADRYPHARPGDWNLSYPLTVVELRQRVGGTNIEFGPTETKVGIVTMTGAFVRDCATGFAVS